MLALFLDNSTWPLPDQQIQLTIKEGAPEKCINAKATVC